MGNWISRPPSEFYDHQEEFGHGATVLAWKYASDPSWTWGGLFHNHWWRHSWCDTAEAQIVLDHWVQQGHATPQDLLRIKDGDIVVDCIEEELGLCCRNVRGQKAFVIRRK